MPDFYQREWQELCERLKATAERLGGSGEIAEAEKFSAQDPPRDYQSLLERVRQAAELAVSWQDAATTPAAGEKSEATA